MGKNDDGQLGDGTTTDIDRPGQIITWVLYNVIPIDDFTFPENAKGPDADKDKSQKIKVPVFREDQKTFEKLYSANNNTEYSALTLADSLRRKDISGIIESIGARERLLKGG